jgi:hypothetical protein
MNEPLVVIAIIAILIGLIWLLHPAAKSFPTIER